MRSALTLAAALFGCGILLTGGGEAAALRVAPTTISLVAPDAASTLSLRNEEDRPINVQVRVFRWTQVDGEDRYEPARDVVASPPAVTLKGGATTLVRVVRVSKAPVAGEESYRIIVDELPDPARRRNGTVAMVLRYSIPVFFASPEVKPAAVAWSVRRHDGYVGVTAVNSGERHMRVSSLTLKDGRGRSATLGDGLAGYILGGSRMGWPVADGNALAVSGRPVSVGAVSDVGPIDAVAAPR